MAFPPASPPIDPAKLEEICNLLSRLNDYGTGRRILHALRAERPNTGTLLHVIAYALAEIETIAPEPDYVLPALAVLVADMRPALAAMPHRHAARPVSPPGRA